MVILAKTQLILKEKKITKTKTNLVKPWPVKKPEDKTAAQQGKKVLTNSQKTLVKYKNQKWQIGELLQHLAAREKFLEREQCKPSLKCLFEGQEVLNKKANLKNLPVVFPIGFYG